MKTIEHKTLALISRTPCVYQGDDQIKDYMRFGLVGQQHEIKTDKHSETWENWRLNKRDSRDRDDTLLRDLVDKAMKWFARKRLWGLGSERLALHRITFRIRVEMFDKDFWAGSSHIGARHPWHMQVFKGTKLGLMSQAKAWIHKHSRVNNHTYRLKLLSKGIYLETTMRLT